jgi:hypothetical protein
MLNVRHFVVCLCLVSSFILQALCESDIEDHWHSQEECGGGNTTLLPGLKIVATHTNQNTSFKRPAAPNSEEFYPKRCLTTDSAAIRVQAVTDTVNALHQITQQYSGAKQALLSEDEFETFGKTIAGHLRQLPVNIALECQSYITSYIIQKRLSCLSPCSSPNMYSAQTSAFLQYPQCSTPTVFTSQFSVGSAYGQYQDNRGTFGATTVHNTDIVLTDKRQLNNVYSDISEAIASIKCDPGYS